MHPIDHQLGFQQRAQRGVAIANLDQRTISEIDRLDPPEQCGVGLRYLVGDRRACPLVCGQREGFLDPVDRAGPACGDVCGRQLTQHLDPFLWRGGSANARRNSSPASAGEPDSMASRAAVRSHPSTHASAAGDTRIRWAATWPGAARSAASSVAAAR